MARGVLPLVVLPVVVGVVGAGIGLATRGGDDPPTAAEVVATDDALDAQAPAVVRPASVASLPITLDGLIGAPEPDDEDATFVLPPDAVLAVPITADATAYPADPRTGEPVQPVQPVEAVEPAAAAALAEFEPREGEPVDDPAAVCDPLASDCDEPATGGLLGEPLAPTPPSAPAPTTTGTAGAAATATSPPATGTTGTTGTTGMTGGIGDIELPAFVDPCVRAPGGCPSGLPGVVLDALEGRGDERILPLEVSRPFAAVGPFATMCARAEADTAPDPDLFPSQRPTVAVLLNRPADLRLAGTWPDGSAIPTTAMQIDDAAEATWRADVDAGKGPGTLLACATVTRADVEANAEGRVARLFADVTVLAGEASVTTGALVDLNVPSAADQLLLATPVVTSLGEIPDPASGILLPTLNVHLEHLAEVAGIPDPSDPTGAPAMTGIGLSTRLVTSGDCGAVAAGRAARGDDVTHGYGRIGYRRETRQVAGRDQIVHVLDHAIQLDPETAPGWQGSLCVIARSFHSGEALAIWRVGVRAPRTPEFDVSIGIEPDFNPEWYFEVRGPCGGLLSNGIIDDGLLAGVAGRRAVACGRMNGRYLAGGIPVRIRAVDPLGITRPWFEARIPVNLEYCNTDDPWSAIVGGCDRSARTHVFSVDLGSARRDGRVGNETYEVSVFVGRNAAPGINMHVDPDPSHQWDVFGQPERLA